MRAALLSVARDVLDTSGPHALSTRRIAARAQTSTTAIYALFGGKHGLTDALYAAGFGELTQVLGHVPTSADARERILALNRAYHAFAVARPALYVLMFERVVPGFSPSAASLGAARASLQPLERALEAAVSSGQLMVSSPEDAALRLWAATHGLVSVELSGHVGAADAPGMLDRTVLNLLAAWSTGGHGEFQHAGA